MNRTQRKQKIGEHRQFVRVDFDNTVAYMLTDIDQKVLDRGIARVMNLSQGGVMIQSKEFIEAYYIKIMVAVAGENDLAMLGKIIHCEDNGFGAYHTGIKFLEGPNKMRQLAGALVRSRSVEKPITGKPIP